MKITQDVADAYSTANRNIYDGGYHLTEKIQAVENEYQFDMLGENWGGTYLVNALNSGKLTIGLMKQALYQDVMGMMFIDGDSSFGHMKNWTTNMPAGYVGLGFDKYGNTHYIIHTAFNKNDTHSDTTPIKHFEQSSDVKASLATAQTDLAQKTTLATAAQADFDKAHATTVSAKAANDTAQTELTNAQNDLKAKKSVVSSLNTKLNATQKQLATNQVKLAGLNQSLADLATARAQQTKVVEAAKDEVTKANAILTDAKKATESAKQALKVAEQQATSMQSLLDTAKQAVLVKQQMVTTKQNALNKAKAEVAQLVNADANLAKAKADLQQAKNELADKTVAYEKAVVANDQAKAKIQSAKQDKLVADQNYNRAMQLLNTLKAKQEIAKQGTASKTDPSIKDKAKNVAALKKYAESLQQSAKAALQRAQKSGDKQDQLLANKLVKAAQTATDRYQTALANLKIAEVENAVDKKKATSEKNVAMLDAKTGVVMPAPMPSKNSSHVEIPYTSQQRLPQTDEAQSERGEF
ncbi:SEC10/PgrA surface exclusion domain-containing protein [Lactiplantibacillus plantarum]|uniref:SEC10/PgrA surface exclusion domain-containing protein n=1 Tax=Lactiplantibacillus plantarum TaxID=1590 RepID=UPI003965A57F